MKRIAIVVLLLLAACTSSSDGSTTKSSTFIGGTEGLTIEFLESAPPSEVFDDSTFPFDVTVKLENDGEFTVPKEKAKVTIKGVDPVEFNNPVIVKNPDEDLEKNFIDPNGRVIDGSITYVNFPGFLFKGDLPGNTPFIIRADLCYLYGSVAQAKMCIREDLQSTEEGVCEVSGQKSVVSSGGPVKVINFEQSPAGKRKMTFSFDVQHADSGLVSRKDTGCSDEVNDKDIVFVTVSMSELNDRLSCSGLEAGSTTRSGFARLFSGKRTIRCTVNVEGVSGDFEKLVTVEVLHDYKEHVERTIIVKDSD